MLLSKRFLLLFLTLAALVSSGLSDVAAQSRRSGQQEDDSENITLTTKDRVSIKITYYPSTLGRDAVPIVMLHNHKENRKVFRGLARALQNPPNDEGVSHAVITVDLRGHGESTTQQGRNGQTIELDAARFGKQDFLNMAMLDMEAVRKFLVKKNEANQLNLNKLCLVGSGMGANVATWFAARDWAAPRLANRKQGQDVKGLVLSSPEWSYRGLPMLKAIRQPGVQREVSFLILYGEEDRKAVKSATTIEKNLQKSRTVPPPEAGPESKDLIVIGKPTALQGTRLLTDPRVGTFSALTFFLDARLVNQDYEWVARRTSN